MTGFTGCKRRTQDLDGETASTIRNTVERCVRGYGNGSRVRETLRNTEQLWFNQSSIAALSDFELAWWAYSVSYTHLDVYKRQMFT